MASPLSTGSVARFAARKPWTVVGIWAVGLVVLIGIAVSLGSVFTSEIEFTNQEEAQAAKNQLESVRGTEPLFEQIVVQSQGKTIDDPAFKATVASILTDVRALKGDVEFGTSYYETNDPSMVSQDRKTMFVPVKLVGNLDSASQHIDPLLAVLKQYDGKDGFTVVTAGFASISATFDKIAKHDLETEQRALPVALLVLVPVFGAVVAALVPAILGIGLALAAATLLSNVFPLSIFVTNMVIMIGLARYRQELWTGTSR